jgi:hypothetical protein
VIIGCAVNGGIAFNRCSVGVPSMNGLSPILTLLLFAAQAVRKIIANTNSKFFILKLEVS